MDISKSTAYRVTGLSLALALGLGFGAQGAEGGLDPAQLLAHKGEHQVTMA